MKLRTLVVMIFLAVAVWFGQAQAWAAPGKKAPALPEKAKAVEKAAPGQAMKLITKEERVQLRKEEKAALRARPLQDRIWVRGMNMKFDVPPVIKDGRTLIPVRAISEGLGAQVQWDAENRKVTITKGEVVVVLYLDSKTVEVNGQTVTLEVPAQSINSRTFVPLRFVSEALGVKVKYDDETGDIEIEDEEAALEEEETEETEQPAAN
ncbi:MAG: copper amine oxidase N-terminal domain-containing protein [Bacillota bacterium]